ncbi:MAG: hypothetical protein BMS9Abin34_288 [Patescibacteria group bacterium]|nr:MAG: hypothetical protein BMS9Abin34_288 [Patescibacteria group bacterium]
MIFIFIAGSKSEEVKISLNKEGKREELMVIFAGRGNDVIDINLAFIHEAPATQGRIIVRGVLRDQSSAKIKGLIRINKGARESEGFLEQRTLLVGERSKVENLPYLEIENHDVKASHAVTVGAVNQEQMFYLRSRGLSEKEALALLIEGFLGQAVAGERGNQVGSKLEEVKAYALG